VRLAPELATLVSAVEAADWDKGWDFRGMGQFGPSLSKLDRLIIALGPARNRGAGVGQTIAIGNRSRPAQNGVREIQSP
jgi:hypothetical protein